MSEFSVSDYIKSLEIWKTHASSIGLGVILSDEIVDFTDALSVQLNVFILQPDNLTYIYLLLSFHVPFQAEVKLVDGLQNLI